MPVLDAFTSGLIQVLAWPAVGYMVLGVLIGIWLGAAPGIGGLTGLAILLPFTFSMEPVPAFALLLGMLSVTATGDTVSSILLGVPGTAASQATILDGHPLAKSGQAKRAFGAAFASSAFGGVFGAFVLALSLPIVLPLILAIAQPEVFAFGVLGLSMVGSLSGRAVYKGLAAGAFGLLLSTVGYAEASAIPRYWLGFNYLIDDLPFLPVVLGLFAIPELMELATRNVSIARVPERQDEGGGMLRGVKDAWLHRWLVVRCSALGAYIGVLPGLGGSIADWFAYGHTVQSAKDKSQFGKGDIRGVIGPEAANNAVQGGALIPTVAFGIPGSAGMAVLLGAFLIQGLRPGPEMLTTNLDLTFAMVWTVAIANLVAACFLMVWVRQVAKLAFVPGHYIIPGTIMFVFMGAWLGGTSVGDWITCLAFGVIGYFMKRGGWARPPVVLGIVLGPIMENAFVISIRAYGGYEWLMRPITLGIFTLVAITLVLAVRGIVTTRRAEVAAAEAGAGEPEPSGAEGGERNAFISLPLAVLFFVTFVGAGLYALQWTQSVRSFPLTVAIPGALMALIAIFADGAGLRRDVRDLGSLGAVARQSTERALLGRSMMFFGLLVGMILALLVIGQKFAIPLFAFVYLLTWGKIGWRWSLVYAVGVYAFMIGFYDRLLHMFWHPSLLYEMLVGQLPPWLPGWLFY